MVLLQGGGAAERPFGWVLVWVLLAALRVGKWCQPTLYPFEQAALNRITARLYVALFHDLHQGTRFGRFKFDVGTRIWTRCYP